MSQVKSSLTIERPIGKDNDLDMEEIEVTITGEYSPFHRGRFEKGGGQVEPDEPECIDDIEATFNGKTIELTDSEVEKAEEELLSTVKDDCDGPEPDDDYEPPCWDDVWGKY